MIIIVSFLCCSIIASNVVSSDDIFLSAIVQVLHTVRFPGDRILAMALNALSAFLYGILNFQFWKNRFEISKHATESTEN